MVYKGIPHHLLYCTYWIVKAFAAKLLYVHTVLLVCMLHFFSLHFINAVR